MLVRALYQWQVGGHDVAELEEQYEATPEYSRIDPAYFKEVLNAVVAAVEKLDTQISLHADRDVATVDAIGRAVLLLGLEELNSRADVPVKVVINEAVELAKRYGPPDCYRFVNAVLDKAAKATSAERLSDAET
jgi:N utilization substance protein B